VCSVSAALHEITILIQLVAAFNKTFWYIYFIKMRCINFDICNYKRGSFPLAVRKLIIGKQSVESFSWFLIAATLHIFFLCWFWPAFKFNACILQLDVHFLYLSYIRQQDVTKLNINMP
jgi:hypothetical protein